MKNDNMNLIKSSDEFKILLNLVRKTRPKGSYYWHDHEEYMSYKTHDFNFLPNFIATNLDWIFYSTFNNTLMLIEDKTLNKSLTQGQNSVFKLIDQGLNDCTFIKYLGFYELKFENFCFEDGKVSLIQQFRKEYPDITFYSYDENKFYIGKLFRKNA